MGRFNLESNPFYNITPPLIIGIIVFNCGVGWIWIFTLLIGAIVYELVGKKSMPLVWSCFLLLGYGLSSLSVNVQSMGIPLQKKMEFTAQIQTIPQINGRYQRTEAKIIAFKELGSWMDGRPHRVQLYIDTTSRIYLGQTISYQSKLYPVDSGSYGRYLHRQGILGRQYAYRIDSIDCDTTFQNRLLIFRDLLSQKIAAVMPTAPQTSALMQSLTIGDKRFLNRSLKSDYNKVGVSHILSISGLHVGIIFAILNILFGWLKIFKHGYIILGISVIIILWGYALLSGGSVSVLRAAVMFTFYQLAMMLSRPYSSINILLSSAFVLLIWNTNYLFDVGFQLSYLAMVGIITLLGPIRALIKTKNRILNGIWETCAVTISAQIMVLPLVIYYFGYIPLFGIIMNLAVWITVPIIIFGTFLFLATGWNWLGYTSGFVANMQNKLVEWAASYKWISIDDIQITTWNLALLYIMIISFTVFIVLKNEKRLRRMVLQSKYNI
ncbi:MAG: ComEC/Rec2 family competence protein [Mucinivorans sp.]